MHWLVIFNRNVSEIEEIEGDLIANEESKMACNFLFASLSALELTNRLCCNERECTVK